MRDANRLVDAVVCSGYDRSLGLDAPCRLAKLCTTLSCTAHKTALALSCSPLYALFCIALSSTALYYNWPVLDWSGVYYRALFFIARAAFGMYYIQGKPAHDKQFPAVS